ncbi:MAG: Mov34/MPN/PAD-1 family protein [Pseudomonadales bacterium]|nr:Mov34/MPN/PAD-1 family protein [Pseudomonadales bacterium]
MEDIQNLSDEAFTSKNSLLWLPTSVCDEMVASADSWTPNETGGVLMGYRANADVVVTKMIGAGPNAVHRRRAFYPDQKFQLTEIARIYHESSGSETYLGDWHTHPTGTTALSLQDKRTLTRVGVTPSSKNSAPIMIILARYPQLWTFRTVQFRSGKIMVWPFVRCSYVDLPYNTY